MYKVARYNIGDHVIHINQRYQAVIIDIDPIFFASGRYNPQVLKREFATRNPWYRLLVNNSSQITYVEEPNLIPNKAPIEVFNNPLIDIYLIEQNGNFYSTAAIH